MSDEPFIERIFESGDDDVIARFFLPSLASGGEYQCEWAIVWPDRVQQRYACGIDGIQALMLAMKAVHSELTTSDLYKSGALTYLDQRDFDLPPSWGNGPLYGQANHDGE